MIVLDLSILNQKGTPMFNSDLTANRPAAGIVGRIFIAIDSPYGIFRDTGTAWDQISSSGGGATTIYNGNGTLTGDRTISSGGFQLVFNPQTTFFTSLTASTSASSFSVLGSNALSFAAGFSSSNIGNVYGANGAINAQNFLGNATFAQANLSSAMVNVNKIDFGSGGHTITMTQSTAPGIRAMTGVQNQIQFTGSHNGTISHAAISQNLGFFRESGSTRTLTITNAYSLLINPLDDYGAGFTFTNRWGIYQAGTSDNNFFAAPTTISNTLTISRNTNVTTGIVISNSQGGTLADNVVVFDSGGTNVAAITKRSATFAGFSIQQPNDLTIVNSGLGDIAIFSNVITGKIKFAAGGALTAQMTLAATGNLLIGSTIDNGEKLQVTGSVRITGKLLTTGPEDDFGGSSTYVRRNNSNLWFYTSATAQGGIGAASGTGFRSVYLSGVNTGYTNDAVYIGTSTTAGTYFQNTYTKIGGVPTSYIATAILELESTTRGFLTPRMTNAQRLAIATPAVGLEVYCTDAVEGKYIYKSTGWTFVI